MVNAYSSGRSTVSDLAERFNVSASTIKRRLENMGTGRIPLEAHDVVVLMDTTYWGSNFGVVIIMDASDSHVLCSSSLTAKSSWTIIVRDWSI